MVSVAQFDYVSELRLLMAIDTDDDVKQNISLRLNEVLNSDFQNPDFKLDSICFQFINKVVSSDDMLCIYSWHYILSDASSQYGGIIKYGNNVFPLKFNDKVIEDNKEYSQDDWCGGVCYGIIPVKLKKKTAYTLLSWDGNNGVTSKKIIDVLSFDRKGNPIFGQSVFETGKSTQKRIIIEYASSSSMLLEYDEGQKAIVCNAIAVNEEKYSDVSEYYCASDLFDIYRFENEKWVLYPNQDLRLNKKESKALLNR